MKTVSLTHLTAVSGANCAIVIGFVYFALARLPINRWFRTCLALSALIFYVLLVGPQPSVLRAALMAAIFMLANALGRATAASQALALTIIGLLISDPWLANDFGFQLSVLATIGILHLAPAIAERLKERLPDWLGKLLSISLAAQLLCIPVLLELQPGLSTYSVPANLLAEPLVSAITVIGISSCLISPLLPMIAQWLSWLASCGAWLVVQIAVMFANLPNSTLGWPSGALGLVFAVIWVAGLAFWFKAKRVGSRRAAFVLLLAICAIGLGSCTSGLLRNSPWPTSNWSVISCDVGQGDATLIRSEGKIALIDVGRKARPINACLTRLGIHRIDFLLLTHFDLDHVGGLDGALAGRQIVSAMITSFRDSRPAAAITWRKLQAHAGSLVAAGRGMHGNLGAFTWKVLSPHQGAQEAEDSNDGSVTMLFQSPQMVVLTLADLGEKGQMRLAAESAGWLGNGFGPTPVVVKVSHHGSADQYPELYEAIKPAVALFSVGLGNDYGHPTQRTLRLLESTGSRIFRTDQQGSISVSSSPEGLRVSTSGRG